MTGLVHKIYIGTLVLIVILITAYLSYVGLSYYGTPLSERFYHNDHSFLKPSGPLGHGLGIVGTSLILFGVLMYIAKKRWGLLPNFGRLKYWLEFHIFLCTLGPIMILFHTAFKFGGIVSIAFWSMVAVVLSGIIGRFIYIQIPRSIEGRELSLGEINDMKTDLYETLKSKFQLDEDQIQKVINYTGIDHIQEGNFFSNIFNNYLNDKRKIKELRTSLKEMNVNKNASKSIISSVKNEISLNNKIARLQTMQKLFKYWHVAHLPFALIMLVIVVIHVGITLAFGYRWIF